MEEQTIYAKLYPPPPTPPDELCQCQNAPIKLMHALSYNPIHCMNCNGEVPPERLSLTPELVELIAPWRELYNAIYYLWLDSRSYEVWAREQLTNIASEVNTRGRAVRAALNDLRRCYYWYFRDITDELHHPLLFCPVCGDTLQDYTDGKVPQRICERDSIVIGE